MGVGGAEGGAVGVPGDAVGVAEGEGVGVLGGSVGLGVGDGVEPDSDTIILPLVTEWVMFCWGTPIGI